MMYEFEDFLLELTPEIYNVIKDKNRGRPIKFLYTDPEKPTCSYDNSYIEDLPFVSRFSIVSIICDYRNQVNHYGRWKIDCEKFNIKYKNK